MGASQRGPFLAVVAVPYTHCISTTGKAATNEADVNAIIRKWGNSLGLRIPKAFADEVGVRVGSEVDLSIEAGDLVVRVRRPRVYGLEELLEGVTAENVHAEVDVGSATGREVW
jgi:antitoxin MazE